MARKTLKDLDKALNKRYKELEGEIIKKGNESSEIVTIPSLDAGLNYLLGNGGIPLGHMITIYGDESSGKTALGFLMLSSIQRNIKYAKKLDDDGDVIEKGVVVLIDAERSYTQSWTEKLGVDTSEDYFRYILPDTGETGLDIVEETIRSGGVDAILIDSLNALIPGSMIENDMGDATMGLQARMFSKAWGRITSLLHKYQVTLINVSQSRESMDKYKPDVIAGGKSTRFYSKILIKARRAEWLGANDKPIGIITKLNAIKNKLSVPKRTCSIELNYKDGFSFISGYITSAIFLDIIKRKGAWYEVPDVDKPMNGTKRVEDYYKENLEEYDKLVEVVNTLMIKKDFEERGILTELEDEIINDEVKNLKIEDKEE